MSWWSTFIKIDIIYSSFLPKRLFYTNKITYKIGDTSKLYKILFFMLSIELEKAFEHNACKKVVQLAKVTVAMTDARLDRYAEENRLFHETDSIISEIEHKYQRNLKKNHKSLLMYRKSIIQKESEKYSSKYQLLKTEFAEFEQYCQNKVNSVESEYKNRINQIQKLTSILILLKDNVQKSMEQPMSVSVPSTQTDSQEIKTLKKKLKSINRKIDDFDYSEEDLEEMEAEYVERVKNLKQKIKNIKEQTSTSLKENTSKFRSRLQKLKQEKETINKKFKSLVEKRKTYTKESQEKRKSLLSDMSSEIITRSKQVSNQINVENSKFEQNKKDLVQQMKQQKKKNDDENSKIQEAYTTFINDASNASKVKQQELKNQVVALNSITMEIADKFQQELEERKLIGKNMKNVVDDSFMAKENQFSKMRQKFSSFDNNLIKMRERNKINSLEEIKELTAINNEMKATLKEKLNKREEIMRKEIDKMNDSNGNTQNKTTDLNKLRNIKEKEEESFQKAYEKASSGLEEKLNAKQQFYNSIKDKKEQENEKQLKVKEEELRKELKLASSSYFLEIDNKKKEMSKALLDKKQSILSEKVKAKDVEPEKKKFGVKKNQFDAMFQFITNQVNQSQKQRSSSINALDQQINDLLNQIAKIREQSSKKSTINSLIKTVAKEREETTSKIPKNASDPIEMMFIKYKEAKTAAEFDVMNEELKLLLLKEENKLAAEKLSKQLDMFKSISIVSDAEQSLEYQKRGYENIITQIKEETQQKKASMQKKFDEQESDVVGSINDYETKIALIRKKTVDDIEKMKETFETELQAAKNKHEVLKERVTKRIEQAKIDQETLVMQNEEEINNLLESRVKTIKQGEEDSDEEILDLSFEETDLMMKCLTPKPINNQKYLETKKEAEDQLIEVRDILEKIIELFTLHLDAKSSPKVSGREQNTRGRSALSTLKVLPPLAKPT